MTNVFWLEQTEANLPPRDDWLSAPEEQVLSALRFPKRRLDWRLGRWTAKRALSLWLGLSAGSSRLSLLEIRAGPLGEPQVLFQGQPAPISISLSHRDGVALCTLAEDEVALGCDLEIVETHSDAFITDYFTEEEQAVIFARSACDRPLLVSLLWSAKESALKALRHGLRLDTRAVNICLEINEELVKRTKWFPLKVVCRDGSHLRGCWCRSGDLLRTLILASPVLDPIPIQLYSDCVPTSTVTTPAQESCSHDELANCK